MDRRPEFVHAHGDRWIEIRLTRKLINQLDDERAHASQHLCRLLGSDPRVEQADLIVELARQALEANRRI